MDTVDPNRIIFLDIDGVLLTERAWLADENAEALRLMRAWMDGSSRDGPQVAMAAVNFDPVAVDLVRRLCRVTGARLVVVSNWRRTFGHDATVAKLVDQGLDRALFHPHPTCPMRATSNKGHDIRRWLDDNRLTVQPEDSAVEAFDAHGITYVVLDDEPLESGAGRLIRTDADTGLSARDYRIACRTLGALDPEAGVAEIAPDVEARLLTVFRGDRLRMARFIHSRDEPLALLQPIGLLAAWMTLDTPENLMAARQTQFWRQAAKAAARC